MHSKICLGLQKYIAVTSMNPYFKAPKKIFPASVVEEKRQLVRVRFHITRTMFGWTAKDGKKAGDVRAGNLLSRTVSDLK